MKTLIYKGFGFDNEEVLIFKILVEKSLYGMLKVEISSNLPFKKDDFLSHYNSVQEETKSILHLAGSISSGFMGIITERLINYSWDSVNIKEEYFFCKSITYKDIIPEDLPDKSPCLGFARCEKMEVAISLIKEIVSIYRKFWREQKNEYNTLVSQLEIGRASCRERVSSPV